MNKVPYSSARKHIRVGDIIGCRGGGFIGRAIRFFKGGQWDWSHCAIVIRDVTHYGRVEVLEALFDGGMERNYISKVYEKDHGKLFWLPMECDDEQREELMELGAQIMYKEYDFKTTFLAIFRPIVVDVSKFNCSEAAWYLLTQVGRLLKRFNKDKEIAPAPGNFPTWSGVDPVELSL